MMSNSSSGRSGEMIVGINVTPMVDVVLVLLIVLMVTASYSVSRSVPLDLPQASSGEDVESAPLAVSVDESGRFFLDGTEMSFEELRRRVRERARGPQTKALIAADGSTAHRHVVAVMDLLRTEGVSKFAINVAPGEADR